MVLGFESLFPSQVESGSGVRRAQIQQKEIDKIVENRKIELSEKIKVLTGEEFKRNINQYTAIHKIESIK